MELDLADLKSILQTGKEHHFAKELPKELKGIKGILIWNANEDIINKLAKLNIQAVWLKGEGKPEMLLVK